MNKQPEALRLADELETEWITPLEFRSAAELRRLHQVNQELVEALELAVRQNSHDMLMTGDELRVCEALIAKHKEQE